MHDSVQGGGVHQRTHSTGYTDLRLQTRPSTPKPCSTAKGGTGRGLGPSPLADLTPVEGRKEVREGEPLAWMNFLASQLSGAHARVV